MVQRAYVVHGHPGWDEATPCGPFDLWIVTPQGVVQERRDPETAYGIPRCAPDDLTGGDADENAAALRAVFDGAKGPHRDAIVLNAALGLEVLGIAGGREAVARAERAIDEGAVRRLLA
jgi:anthranilate phosphoribosyltransferase